jgi:hypothetical protein
MSEILKINNVATGSISHIDNIATDNISNVLGITFPASGAAFTTDKLYLWYDASLQSTGDTTLYNKVSTLTESDVLSQSGHDASAYLTGVSPVSASNAKIVDGISINTGSDTIKAAHLPGVSRTVIRPGQTSSSTGYFDYFTKRAATPSTQSSDIYGVQDADTDNSGSDDANFAVEDLGFTTEVWLRSQDAFVGQGNIWSSYGNVGIRARFDYQGQPQIIAQKITSSGSVTHNEAKATDGTLFSQDTWTHHVVTLSAPDSSGNVTLKLYKNADEVTMSNSTFDYHPSNYYQDFTLFGGSFTPSNTGYALSERGRFYFAIFRQYIKPLTQTEITANYNAEKARFGIT